MLRQQQSVIPNFITSYDPVVTPYPNDDVDIPPPPGITNSTPVGAGNFGAVTAMASTAMHPAGNFGVVTPHALNNVTVTTKQPGIIQSVQCDVCNITCSSADVLKTHELGKKHLKNLQRQAVSPVIASLMPTPPASNTPSFGELEDKKRRLLQNGASDDTLINCDLCNVVCNNQNSYQSHIAGKKHSAKAIMQQAGESGILIPTSEGVSMSQPLTSVAFQCELCKISCTCIELLKMHLSGKKHQKKLKELAQLPDPPLTPVASLDTPATKPKENPESGEGKTVILHEDKSTSCEICGINCDTYDVLKTHLVGKKHLKNLEKLKKTIHNPAPITEPHLTLEPSGPHNPAPTAEPFATPKTSEPHYPVSTTEPLATLKTSEPHNPEPLATPRPSEQQNPAPMTEPLATPKPSESHNPAPKTESLATPTMVGQLQDSLKDDKVVNDDGSIRKGKRAGSHVDLETKKQKIMQEGGSSDALRACTMCNVVCNSPMVFGFHLDSKKHAAMVLKQAESLATAIPSGPPNPDPNTEPLATPTIVEPLQDSLKEDGKIVNEDGSSRKGKRARSHEDLETKKQKIMQVGTSVDSLRACTVCNIVCNSPSVFDAHLAGQKHAAMVAKQAEAQSTGQEKQADAQSKQEATQSTGQEKQAEA